MKRIETFNRLLNQSFQEPVTAVMKICLMVDILWERLRYGTELQDYFQYEFFKLKNCERRNYMTFSKLRYTMQICNDPQKREIFDDKVLFNQKFSKYLYRDWLDVTIASIDQFQNFIGEHPVFFAKARSGMFGKNAGRYDVTNRKASDEIKSLFEKLKENGCIVEQMISQHPGLASFNKSSVNTIRVVTLRCANGKPKVMAGVLRIGRAGKTADNFHHYGIAATIDIDTGIVNSPGIDREFERYITHPDSGKQIIGFNIPSWDKVKNLVYKAASIVPEVRYIGWDIAIDAFGNVQLVEGNYGADPDVTQMPCRIGKWPLFKKELDEIQRLKLVDVKGN